MAKADLEKKAALEPESESIWSVVHKTGQETLQTTSEREKERKRRFDLQPAVKDARRERDSQPAAKEARRERDSQPAAKDARRERNAFYGGLQS